MIRFVKRNEIDISKYDYCIEKSIQSKLCAFSWYLDIVTNNWGVLVLNDYEAVMPIPLKTKFGFSYVHHPFWTLELGIFSLNKDTNTTTFLEQICLKYKYINLRLNTDNHFNTETNLLSKRKVQVLELNKEINVLINNFRKDRKKDLKKATNAGLEVEWYYNSNVLIELFKKNIAPKTPYIIQKDYEKLTKLIEECVRKSVGELCIIKNSSGKAIASGFFIKHQNTVTLLVSATDYKNRKNGANSLLITSALQRFNDEFQLFNFGGSTIESIASYFKSFNAKTIEYSQIHQNKLPKIVRWLKS